jgi:hypothetical protein
MANLDRTEPGRKPARPAPGRPDRPARHPDAVELVPDDPETARAFAALHDRGQPTRAVVRLTDADGAHIVEGHVILKPAEWHAVEDPPAGSQNRWPEDDDDDVSVILRRPEMLTAEAFGQRCGVSRQAVNTWRRERRILALAGPARRLVRYPGWQVTPRGQLIAGLDRVLAVLTDAWDAYDFLVTRHPGLADRPPWQALADGEVDAVLALLSTDQDGDYR